MGIFLISDDDRVWVSSKNKRFKCIESRKFDSFNSNVLGLGDISAQSKRIEALCAIFDFQGFTDFCKQVDPRLVVPEFLSKFLDWFYEMLKKEIVSKKFTEGYKTYCDPPIFSKYMGDGIMLIWDVGKMHDTAKCNIVATCYEICKKYNTGFYETIKKDIAYCPSIMRCGIAMGDIYTVGNGSDFFGACINIAARLQKLGSLTFCVSRRGFDFKKYLGKGYKGRFEAKQAQIRGIGDKELVYVLKTEYAEYKKIETLDNLIVKDIE